jgi:hypothetical protein
MSRRVLFLAGGRLAVYHWDRGELLEPLWFAADEDGLTEFSLYLDHSPRDPVYLLVDVVEEEFREESIPHVVGGDRSALVRTRLNRLFRDPTYSYAEVQGREPEGRRDDRVLFTALIRPDLLSPWIGQIAKHKVPLAGIYSLPIISEGLIRRLPVDSDHALLVTMQSSGGLRQTFFRSKRVKLSRLAIMPPGETPGHASYVLGEVEKIRRYLNSLRQLPQDSPLDVYIVGTAGLLADVTRQSPDSLTTRYHLYELEEVANRVGIKGEYGSANTDRIFAHLLAQKRPSNQYAPSYQTRHYTMHRTRIALIAASVVLFVTSLAIGGTKLAEGIMAAGESVSLRNQIAFYDERIRKARADMPKTPAAPRAIMAAVNMAGTLRDYKTTPLAMMATLSEGLSDFQLLKLDDVEWIASTNPDAPIGEKGRAAASSPRARGEAAAESDQPTLYQIAQVKGRVDPFSGNYREALDLVRAFADTLRQLPNVENVDILDLPLDIGSQQVISGSTSRRADTAPFELRIVIRDKHREAG